MGRHCADASGCKPARTRAVLIAAGAVAVGAVAVAVPAMTAAAGPAGKVTLCHRTDSQTNPYVQITIATAGAFNGHFKKHKGTVWTNTHPKEPKWGDIIPPFTFRGTQYSLNWDSQGQAIFDIGCRAGGPTPTSSMPPPPPSSTS